MMKPMPRRATLLARLSLWLAALWWGSLGTIGFGVVPLLFVHLPTPAMAGAMAAKLFAAQTWVSVVCGLLLALSRRSHPDKVPPVMVFVAGGMLLALLAEFAVAPRILARDNIALWHRVGSGMYLAQWLCACATLWKMSDSRSR